MLRSIRLGLYFSVGLLLGAFVTFANAGYALPSPPSGFSVASAGSYFYKAPAAVAAANEAFNASVVVNAAGKSVTMPAAMRFASNGGQFAVAAVRSNPWLAVGTVAVWLASEYIEWDGEKFVSTQSQYESPEPGTGFARRWGPSDGICSFSTPCSWSGMISYITGTVAPAEGKTAVQYVSHVKNGNDYKILISGLDQWGWYWSYEYTVANIGTAEDPSLVPTEADWSRLASGALPFEVGEPIARAVPMPVQQPELSPVEEPLSPPYIDPVTGQPYRDMLRISPAPTPENPFRVKLDPYKQPMTSGEADAVPDTTLPNQAADPVTEEQKQLCEEYPDASACAPLGSGTAEDVAEQAVDVNQLQPVSIGATGGACPADRVMNTRFGTLTFSWSLLCAYAEGVRPVVLAIAWLSAAFGFFYGAKRSM